MNKEFHNSWWDMANLRRASFEERETIGQTWNSLVQNVANCYPHLTYRVILKTIIIMDRLVGSPTKSTQYEHTGVRINYTHCRCGTYFSEILLKQWRPNVVSSLSCMTYSTEFQCPQHRKTKRSDSLTNSAVAWAAQMNGHNYISILCQERSWRWN